MNQKTKKTLLLISTIITFIVDILYAFAIYSGIIELEVIGDIAMISNNTQMIILVLCAFINAISIIFISKDYIVHKKKLKILNVIHLLLGNIVNIISGIINIILL